MDAEYEFLTWWFIWSKFVKQNIHNVCLLDHLIYEEICIFINIYIVALTYYGGPQIKDCFSNFQFHVLQMVDFVKSRLWSDIT